MRRMIPLTCLLVVLLGAAVVGQQASPQPASPPASSSTSGQQPDSGNPESTSPITPQTPAQSPTDQNGMFVFKRQVQEVVLHATVVDEKRNLETYLDKGAFAVFEDGRPQTITSFRREDVPVAIGILIDNSSSMRNKRKPVNDAVVNLIRASNPQDQVFVVNFSQNSYLDQDFTSDINLLQRALDRTTMRGSTALYDAIKASAEHLKSNSQLDKKILLVITDGEDNMSRETLQDVTRYLGQKNGPALYAIGLMDVEAHHQRDHGREALQKLSDATGGSAYFPESLNDVNDITSTLAHDIRRQYAIAYRPQNQGANGSYHPIMVQAHANGYGKLTVRTRTGYYTGESVR